MSRFEALFGPFKFKLTAVALAAKGVVWGTR